MVSARNLINWKSLCMLAVGEESRLQKLIACVMHKSHVVMVIKSPYVRAFLNYESSIFKKLYNF